MNRKIRRNYSKWFLTKVKHAIIDFKMIQDGDKIAVGVSGGKDSITLLFILNLLKKWSNFKFDIYPISLELGFNTDFSPVEQFCREEGLPYHVEKTDIGKIVFDIRKEKNPCALCSNLRRGALHETAIKLGCRKVALGHHLDDAIETFFLNLFYTGQMSTFKPNTFLDRTGLWLIRPMVYLTRETVSAIAKAENLPVVQNPCPASGKTKREDIKEVVNYLQKRYPKIKERFLTAFLKSESPLWDPKQI
ncbi:MAG: PP-loop domain protein [Clostridia bacterium 41_269]|nr:MAG: PP-loop domain protein [Clostridia bacterium 41_269]